MLKILLNTVNCEDYPKLTTLNEKPVGLEQNNVCQTSTVIPTKYAVISGP